jgi:hypothetical protein
MMRYGATPAITPATMDAFGRLRVSELQTIFDAKTIYDDAPLYFVNNTAGGGTVVFALATASNALTVPGGAGARATRQSRRYLDYQPGKSQKIELTYNLGSGPQANIAKRVGFFDNGNGVFYQAKGLVNQFVRRSNTTGAAVDTEYDQSAWNIDRLDGQGKSGINLDTAQAQILTMDLEWLGVGTVRYGFIIDGRIVYAHAAQRANVASTVWAQTPNLPVRWEIENLAASAGGSLNAICCTVGSESAAQLLGLSRPADRGITGILTNQTLRQLIAIRLKAAYNRATVVPRLINLLSSTNSNARWVAQINPTVTGGPAAVWVPKTNSAIEYDVTRTTGGAGTLNEDGIDVGSGYFSSSADSASLELAGTYALASDYAGVSDILVIGIQNLAAANETYFGSITWSEET